MILDLTALRYFLLMIFTLTGCAAQVQNDRARVDARGSDELQQLRLSQQELSQQVQTLEEQVRQLEVRLQTQQATVATLPPHPTEMVMGTGQKTDSSPILPDSDAAAATVQTATDIYLKAFTDYASGRYNEAISGFRLFIERFPANDFSGNAQFWLGECYYSQRLLSKAITEFSLAAERYPDGSKAPDALLKMATIYSELNQPDKQQQTEERLLELYPQSSAGKKLRSSRSH